MELYLYQNGFKPSESGEGWVKGTWTVRIFQKEIEIYDDIIDDASGRYIMIEKDLDTLKKVLKDAKLV